MLKTVLKEVLPGIEPKQHLSTLAGTSLPQRHDADTLPGGPFTESQQRLVPKLLILGLGNDVIAQISILERHGIHLPSTMLKVSADRDYSAVIQSLG